MGYDFDIVIGDHSNDGHGEKEVFRASAKKPIDAIRAVYAEIPKLGIDLSGFCCNGGGDDIIPTEVMQRLQDILGADFELTAAWYDEGLDVYHIEPEQMARIIVDLLNHLDASLDVALETVTVDLPELITGRNVGYGLFSSDWSSAPHD